MARCFCPCHVSPGVYPPPCGVCGHDDRQGRLVGTIRDGWEPNPPACFMCDRALLEVAQIYRCATGFPLCAVHREELTGNMNPALKREQED